jgi:hypothetical protein
MSLSYLGFLNNKLSEQVPNLSEELSLKKLVTFSIIFLLIGITLNVNVVKSQKSSMWLKFTQITQNS